MAKCGEIMVWHWSHFGERCEDAWAEESDWHLAWKEWALGIGWNVEVPIERDGKRHRADIFTPSGYVIELQHSPLSTTEIAERERFYDKMVWIWDVESAYERFTFKDERASGPLEIKFRWKRPRWSLCAVTKPLYLDFRDGHVLQAKLTRRASLYGDYDVCLGRGHWRDPDEDFLHQFDANQTRLAI